MSKPSTFGNLYKNLEQVRDRVFRGVLHNPLFVWADANGVVRGTRPENAPEVPTAWIAGTFDVGATPDDIEKDLRLVLRERCRDIILD
ncbi:MAG: hypothetical protein ABIS07_05165 [Dokdonella sp.]